MRIDKTTENPDLESLLRTLHAEGAVVDVLTSDLELWARTGMRKPTIIYRPSAASPDHVWLACPVISGPTFDKAMDYYEAHWLGLLADPQWQEWARAHPVPTDVAAAP